MALIEVNDYASLVLKNGTIKYQNDCHDSYNSAGIMLVDDYGTLLCNKMNFVVQKAGYAVRGMGNAEITLSGGRYETLCSHTVFGFNNTTLKLTNNVELTLTNNANSSVSLCSSLQMTATDGNLVLENAVINGGIVIREQYLSSLTTDTHLYFVDGARQANIYECSTQEAIDNNYGFHWVKDGSLYYFVEAKVGYVLKQNVHLYSKSIKSATMTLRVLR